MSVSPATVVPSGATIREIMLLTDGDIGRPPCIDAEINGVRSAVSLERYEAPSAVHIRADR